MTEFELSYDYRCPFAKNVHLHVITALRAGAAFSVNFVPWSLSQTHRDDESVDVWDDAKYDADLLSLYASVSVRDQQADLFLDAHEALFRARHRDAIRLVTMDELTRVLEPLGVDMQRVSTDIASGRPRHVLQQSHETLAKYEAFGVPTFVVDGSATFVRYMSEPSDDGEKSIRIIESLVAMMVNQPDLNEFKHTQIER